MIESITLALSALASLTGLQSSREVVADYVDFKNIAQVLGTSVTYDNNNNYCLANVDYIDDLYGLDGSNQYLEVVYNDGYLIYDKLLNKIVEKKTTERSPYSDIDIGTLKIFVPNNENPGYIYYDEPNFNVISKRSTSEQFNIDFAPVNSVDFPNITHIPNSFFFQNLWGGHGNNYDGFCGLVATEILFNYTDTFFNDNVVDEKYEIPATESSHQSYPSNNIESFSCSPATGNNNDRYDFSQRYVESLIDSFTEVVGVSPHNGRGTYMRELISFINYYLQERQINYRLNTCEGNLADILTDRTVSFAKDTINAGRPVIIGGGGHCVVGYAYDDDFIYVHTGWGYTAAVPWSVYHTSIFDLTWDTGAIDIEILEHVHSDNYYSSFYNEYYCPCGVKMTDFTLSPTDWNYDPQYYFYEKHQEHSVDGINFSTDRLRCGFIENECINLSARRLNAGYAYLKVNLPFNIYRLNIDISWWSENENIENGYALIRYKDNLNENCYYQLYDLKNDITLSTDRENMDHLSFAMPQETNGIAIYTSNQSVGDRNKGRLSIGNVSFRYICN